MNAQELRIGNWVRLSKSNRWSDKYSGEYVQVTADCFGISEMGGRDTDDYDPIPLTPEILEMAGFKKLSQTEYYKPIDTFNNTIGINFDFVHEFVFVYLERVQLHIKHLHQIQNVIFALTGTELNIQL